MGWEFVVSGSRKSPVGGIIVEGELKGVFEGSGKPATLHLNDDVRTVPQAILGRRWTHYYYTVRDDLTHGAEGQLPRNVEPGLGRIHLRLLGLEDEVVPPGAVLRGPVAR